MKSSVFFKLILIFSFLSAQAHSQTCYQVLKEKIVHENIYDQIIQDFVIDHDVFTHRIFVVGMLQFFYKRNIVVFSSKPSDKKERRKAKTIKYQFKHATTFLEDLKKKIKILSPAHKKDFIHEVFEFVKTVVGLKEVSFEERQKLTPILDSVNEDEMNQIKEAWLKYSEERLQKSFYHILGEDYLEATHLRIEISAHSDTLPYQGEEKIGAVLMGTLLSVLWWFLDLYESWINLIDGSFGWIDWVVVDIIVIRTIYKLVYKASVKSDEVLKAEIKKKLEDKKNKASSIAVKKLLGLGLVEGTVFDRGEPVSYHPAVEPDGKVVSIEEVDQLERLMQTFKVFPEAQPVLSDRASSREILEYGAFLDEAAVKASNMVFESWQNFVKLNKDFPKKLSKFQALVSLLTKDTSSRNNENILELKDHARDFKYTKEAILQIIDVFEHVIDYNRRVKETLISYKKVLESYQLGAKVESLSKVTERRMNVLQKHLDQVDEVENEFNVLLDSAIDLSVKLSLTAVLPSHIEAMVSSRFSESSVEQVSHDLEALIAFLRENNVKLGVQFDDIQERQIEEAGP